MASRLVIRKRALVRKEIDKVKLSDVTCRLAGIMSLSDVVGDMRIVMR